MAEPPFGHEPSAIAVKRILRVGGVFGIGLIFTVLIVWVALHYRHEPARARLAARPPVLPPLPRLQAHPAAELAALRAEKQALLDGWGWSGGGTEYAHIPIERAMVLYVQEQQRLRAGASGAAAPPGPRR